MSWKNTGRAALGPVFLLMGMFPTLGYGGEHTSWTTYRDPGIDLTLSYPTDWNLLPRTIAPNAVGQLITLTGPKAGQGFQCSVAIGQDLNEIGDDSSLLEWARSRAEAEEEAWGKGIPSASTPEWKPQLADFSERVQLDREGRQTVYLRHGRLVWFVHTHIGGDTCEPMVQRIISSLHLGPTSPATRADLAHVTVSMEDRQETSNPLSEKQTPSVAGKLAWAWYAPVGKDLNGKPWGILCGSPLHTQGASYAADIQVPYGTEVRAAKEGTIFKVGDSNEGFGKYVVIESNGYYHYYAHLSSIQSYITQGYQVKRHGLLLGYSGNSGLGQTGTKKAHLHFHVQELSSYSASKGVSLVGMTGFTSLNNYPSGSGICGSMGY